MERWHHHFTNDLVSLAGDIGGRFFYLRWFFFYRSNSERVIKLEEKLEELQKKHQQLKQNESMLALMILEEISSFVTDDSFSGSYGDEKELLYLLQIASDSLHKIAEDIP